MVRTRAIPRSTAATRTVLGRRSATATATATSAAGMTSNDAHQRYIGEVASSSSSSAPRPPRNVPIALTPPEGRRKRRSATTPVAAAPTDAARAERVSTCSGEAEVAGDTSPEGTVVPDDEGDGRAGRKHGLVEGRPDVDSVEDRVVANDDRDRPHDEHDAPREREDRDGSNGSKRPRRDTSGRATVIATPIARMTTVLIVPRTSSADAVAFDTSA